MKTICSGLAGCLMLASAAEAIPEAVLSNSIELPLHTETPRPAPPQSITVISAVTTSTTISDIVVHGPNGPIVFR